MGTMRGLFRLLLTVAAGLAIGYGLHLYFKAPPPSTAFERLSTRIEGDIDAILSPLDDEGAPMPTQALRELRENFQDEMSKANRKQRPMYEVATGLCDILLQAVGEREKYLIRLMDSRSKLSAATLARPPQQVSSGVYYSSPGYRSDGGQRERYQQLSPAGLERNAVAVSADQQRETNRLNSFFEGAIKKDWANKTQSERHRIADQYFRLRALERSSL